MSDKSGIGIRKKKKLLEAIKRTQVIKTVTPSRSWYLFAIRTANITTENDAHTTSPKLTATITFLDGYISRSKGLHGQQPYLCEGFTVSLMRMRMAEGDA